MTDDDDGIAGWDIDIENLLAWDKQINEHEHNANLIRWLYGKAMLASRGDRQRLPKGALHAMHVATGNSRRELQYRMAFADKFRTRDACATVLHLSWHEIIGQHLTHLSRSDDDEVPETGEKPGKVVDGVTVMPGRDAIKAAKDWDHKIFRADSIAGWSHDERLGMIRWLKRWADRIQKNL
jgi:hypothetical protein